MSCARRHIVHSCLSPRRHWVLVIWRGSVPKHQCPPGRRGGGGGERGGQSIAVWSGSKGERSKGQERKRSRERKRRQRTRRCLLRRRLWPVSGHPQLIRKQTEERGAGDGVGEARTCCTGPGPPSPRARYEAQSTPAQTPHGGACRGWHRAGRRPDPAKTAPISSTLSQRQQEWSAAGLICGPMPRRWWQGRSVGPSTLTPPSRVHWATRCAQAHPRGGPLGPPKCWPQAPTHRYLRFQPIKFTVTWQNLNQNEDLPSSDSWTVTMISSATLSRDCGRRILAC